MGADRTAEGAWARMDRLAAELDRAAWQAASRRAGGRAPAREEVDAERRGASLWVKMFDDFNREVMGGSLHRMDPAGSPAVGREDEIEMLEAVLERPVTPVALLLGEAGVGKTAIVEEFVRRAQAGSSALARSYLPLALRLGELAAMPASSIQGALATVLPRLRQFEDMARLALADDSARVVLFIDEMHMMVTIFGPGTKIGGDLMKDMLARCPVRVVGATTRREYDSTIAVDRPLAERFKNIEVVELPAAEVGRVARAWWAQNAPCASALPEEVVGYVVESNRAYRPEQAEPRKTLDILEDLASYCSRTGLPPTRRAAAEAFRRRLGIDTELSFDAEGVYREVSSRIKGQPAALESLRLLLHATSFRSRRNPHRPVFTALFTGSTGTGKALADDTLVPVADRRVYCPMGELRRGDVVFDERGCPCRVLGVYPQGELEAWECDFGHGDRVVCSADHLWPVVGEGGSWSARRLEDAGGSFELPAAGPVERQGGPNPPGDPRAWALRAARVDLGREASGLCGEVLGRPAAWRAAFLAALRALLAGGSAEGGGAAELAREVACSLGAGGSGRGRRCLSVVRTGQRVPMTCIEVGSASRLFLCSRAYLPTHNTETSKAIADRMHPEGGSLYALNCPDFASDELEPSFRRALGERLRHVPGSVVLLDEVEKAAPAVRNALLSILDEGTVNFEVVNREGREEVHSASLRDAVVIATTNAGEHVFDDERRFNGEAIGREGEGAEQVERARTERLMDALRENLIASGMRPEMLGRFDQIVPFRALSERASLEIVEEGLGRMLRDLEEQHGIECLVGAPVRWDPDQYDCTATDVAVYVAFRRARVGESRSGGARALARQLEQAVFFPIVQAVLENPGKGRFGLRVEGARSRVDPDLGEVWTLDVESQGRVVVSAL